jgi:cytochrome P450
MTMDIITYLCFGQSVDAINAPGFKAPIIEAMDASLPVPTYFKHSELYKNMIMKCPPDLSRKISPATRGLVDMQEMIKSQIRDLTQHPENLKHLPHNMTIYHQLMDREAYRTNTVPSEGSLYEEAQALMFAGSDTTGNALMVGTFYLLKRPETYAKLKQEILSIWPKLDADPPTLRELERLPYLNAVIKESLRLSVGVVSGLLRVVPKGGTKICDKFVPGGVRFSPPSRRAQNRSEFG